jgi:AcrR family transcriptional regulator
MADPGEALDARERIMSATVACVQRVGVRGFSLEDVAAEAGVSRTTVYRYFPGGRSQLVEQTATWEVARFWGRLAEAIEDVPDLEDRLVAGLVIGRKVMARSSILSNLMDADFEELVAAVQPSEPLIHGVIRVYLREALEDAQLAGTLRDGLDLELAADYLTRMVLSWLGSPAGIDLTDESATRAVVRREFLAGIVAPPDR